MGKGRCEIRIGTSGWHYDHWRGRFYPDKLPKRRWFQHYAQHFDTVEVNNTFYRLPRESTVQNWRQQAPPGFVYVVKANRFITHVKKLRDVTEQVQRFFEVIDLLEGTLGPVLYQLPPSLHQDLDLLAEFIALLPQDRHAVFEFRHGSWYSEETFALLAGSGVAFCVHDMQSKQTPRVVTGDVIYLRFHGTSGRYAGNYTDAMLAEWADWIKSQRKEVRAVYAYFNNDVEGHAINNARTLRTFLNA
ncbi:MAG: DUF72 domain-containing protein [Phycisphaerales bacterium]|nr:MAG: DUF72 domain-containing protein [Phycisphaerales bacterium]